MDRVARALELITKLTAASTLRRAVDTFEQAVEPFGVKVYHGVTRGNWTRDPVPIGSVSNWPDEWRDFYIGKRAITFDPVVRALGQSDGFFWRNLPRSESVKSRTLMRDAREFGMLDGFSAVHHVTAQLSTGFSLAGDGIVWNELERGVVRFLSDSLMSRMLFLREVRLAPAVKSLSGREADILSHAALGHDDRAIAAELGMTYSTVRHHWRSIRTKLDAADRAQAVAVGIWSGQILP